MGALLGPPPAVALADEPADAARLLGGQPGPAHVLHPVQQNSNDRVLRSAAYTTATGTFTVPAITTAVFVVERPYTPPPAVVPQVKHKFDKPIAVAIGSLFLLLVAGLIYLVVRRFTRKDK